MGARFQCIQLILPSTCTLLLRDERGLVKWGYRQEVSPFKLRHRPPPRMRSRHGFYGVLCALRAIYDERILFGQERSQPIIIDVHAHHHPRPYNEALARAGVVRAGGGGQARQRYLHQARRPLGRQVQGLRLATLTPYRCLAARGPAGHG